MKKRILSLLCAVAVLATMLSVVTFSASAETPQKAVGEVINILPWNADNWSWSYVADPTTDTNGVRFVRTASGSKDKERVTYNTAYDFSDGFTVEYTAAADSSSNWIDSAKDLGNDVYLGGFVGNVSFGVWIELVGTDADKADRDRVIYPAIFIGDEVIKGEAECTLENADQAKYYFNKATKSGYVQDGKFAVSVADYDADTNTLTFTRTSAGGKLLSSVSYTDTEGKIDVSNAQAGMRFNTSAKLGEYYKAFTVTGKERTATTPKAMGEVININPYVADKWTANENCAGVTVDSTNGGIKFTKSSGKKDVTLTYNTAYDFSDGFTVTYTSGNGNGNWVNGLLYHGGFVGNVSFGVLLEVDDGKTYRKGYTAILVDGAVVAQSTEPEFVFDTDPGNATKAYFDTSGQPGYYAQSKADYNAETGVVTFTRTSSGGTLLSSVSYTDTEGKINVSNAKAGITFNNSEQNAENYRTFTVNGKTESPAAVGQTVSLMPFVAGQWSGEDAQWTCTGITAADVSYFASANSVKFGAPNNKNTITLTNTNAFDYSGGFTVEYSAATTNSNWIDYFYLGGFVGNVTFGIQVELLDDDGTKDNKTRVIKSVIMVNDAIVASTEECRISSSDSENAKSLTAAYFNDVEGVAGPGGYAASKVVYDPDEKTVTFTRTSADGDLLSEVIYEDTANKIKVANVRSGITFNAVNKNSEIYRYFTVYGIADEHEHVLTEIPAQEKTCDEKGLSTTYYVCDDEECGRFFIDEAGKSELSAENVAAFVIDAGHDFTSEIYQINDNGTHQEKCANCEVYGEEIPHVFTEGVCVCGAKEVTVDEEEGTIEWVSENTWKLTPAEDATEVNVSGITSDMTVELDVKNDYSIYGIEDAGEIICKIGDNTVNTDAFVGFNDDPEAFSTELREDAVELLPDGAFTPNVDGMSITVQGYAGLTYRLLKNDGNGWNVIKVKNSVAEDGMITFTDDNYNPSEQALYSVAFGKKAMLLMGQNSVDEINERYYTEPVSLAGYHLMEGVSTDVGGLMGRQGRIIDDQTSKTEGRTIIGMSADDLINVDSTLVIIGSDGNRNVNISLDCAYTYFYNGTTRIDASGVKIDNDTMAAAFAIVDNDGEGNAISGYGYYRLYNENAESESNFLFDVLLAAPKA